MTLAGAISEPEQAEGFKPIRVEECDLDGPAPDLRRDVRHSAAWLVGRRAGIPQGIVEVDLSPGPQPAAQQVAAMVGLPAVPTAPGWASVPDAELPRISVVVPSIVARIEELDRCLAGFDGLDYPDFEVVLVDNRRLVPADDPLPRLVADHRHVRVARARCPGISSARNVGLGQATGDVVVFTDDDVRVDPLWLRALGRRFAAAPDLQAVTGLILPAELETPAQVWFERLLRRVQRRSYMNRRVFIEAVGPVKIGADSTLGMEAMILTSRHAIDDHGPVVSSRHGRPVTIGERA